MPHKCRVHLRIMKTDDKLKKIQSDNLEGCNIPWSRMHGQYKNHTFEDSGQRGSISSDLSSISVRNTKNKNKYKPVKKTINKAGN